MKKPFSTVSTKACRRRRTARAPRSLPAAPDARRSAAVLHLLLKDRYHEKISLHNDHGGDRNFKSPFFPHASRTPQRAAPAVSLAGVPPLLPAPCHRECL